MKVKVNEDKCFGCGGCIGQIDTVFDFNDEGRAFVKKEELTDEEKENVKDFVDNSYCPGDAISYEE